MAEPNWYPDPTGRFELRYFDGGQWTAHVATGGVASTDPLPDQQAPLAASSQTDTLGSWSGAQGPGYEPAAAQPSDPGSYQPQDVWQPSEPPPSGQGKGVFGLLAALAAVVLLVAGGVYLLAAGRDDDGVEAIVDRGADSDAGTDDEDDGDGDDATSTSTTAPSSTTVTSTSSTTAPPTAGLPAPTDPRVEIPEYGTDPEFDGLADDCQGGDMGACDALYRDSALGSGYEAYGDSCGGRNEPAGYCATIYGSS